MPLTRQQLLDEAIVIANSQGKPCMDDRGWNQFHHNKLRSFTGSWIPIDIGHDMEINSMDARLYIKAFPELFASEDESFICELERIHDDCDPDEWGEELKQFAEEYDLAYEPEGMKWQQTKPLSTRLRAS